MMLARYFAITRAFWDQAPALYYCLFILFGALYAFTGSILFLIPALPLFIHNSFRMPLAALAGILFWFYAANYAIYPPAWVDSMHGKATFTVEDWSHELRYNRPYCKMKLLLQSFEGDNESFYAQNIPCRLSWSQIATRPKSGIIYEAGGVLSVHNGIYSFKAEDHLKPKGSTFSLVDLRHTLKAKVKLFLAKYLKSGETRSFLEGVLIGEFHDAHLKDGLKRFGLQHITVVSGFHFSLIAVILAAFFRMILPWKWMQAALIIATSSYLLFIGPSPSVLRAWAACTILFLSKLLERDANGLNSLGAGLILVLSYDPAACLDLGFQLSFLATFAILLFYPLFDRYLRALFPTRSATEILSMPFSEQLLFVLLRFFTASFGLVLSVSTLMLPMSLYAFGEFPLLGIVYNAFFPFLVSIGIFVVALAFLFMWVEPIASLFFQIAAALLDTALTFISYAPSWLDITLRASWISAFFLITYLSAVSLLGILLKKKSLP